MRVSTTLGESELANLANLLELDIEHMRVLSPSWIEFVLRPFQGPNEPWYRKSRYPRQNGKRQRIWNVCHHGHTIFLGALYTLDPEARVRSSVGNWNSADDYFTDVKRIGETPIETDDGSEPFYTLCWCEKGPGIDDEMMARILEAAVRLMSYVAA